MMNKKLLAVSFFAMALGTLGRDARAQDGMGQAGRDSAQGAPNVSTAGETAGKLRLRLRLRPGQAFVSNLRDESRVAVLDGSDKSSYVQNLYVSYSMRVLHVDAADNANLRITFQDVRIAIKTTNPKAVLSKAQQAEANAEKQMMMRVFRSLIGQSVTAKMSPLVKMLQVRGMDVLLERMISSLQLPRDAQNDPAWKQVKAQLKKSFSDNALKNFSNGFTPYSERALSIGDSWASSTGAGSVLLPSVKTTYTLKSRSNGVAVVAMRTVFGGKPKSSLIQVPGVKVTMSLSGTQTGTVRIDEATGLSLGGNLRTDLQTRTSTQMTGAYARNGKADAPTVTSERTKGETHFRTVPYSANKVVAKPAAPSAKPASTPAANQLVTEDLVIGTGEEAKSGDKVTVHYRGRLTDGTVFDESYKRGEPFEFDLGAGQVIEGWDKGVAGMKIGGKRRLTIPSSMGYGARGAGEVIPPNATLIFEVELLKVN